jgi:hypothetical protein
VKEIWSFPLVFLFLASDFFGGECFVTFSTVNCFGISRQFCVLAPLLNHKIKLFLATATANCTVKYAQNGSKKGKQVF